MEGKTIFLMGIKRNGKYDARWMADACAVLEEENYKGLLQLPDEVMSNEEELNAVSDADLVVCWIDKSAQTEKNWTMPHNYGKIFESGKVLYGRAPGMDMTRHIDWLYEADYNRKPYTDLRELLKEAIKTVNEKGKVNMINKNVY